MGAARRSAAGRHYRGGHVDSLRESMAGGRRATRPPAMRPPRSQGPLVERDIISGAAHLWDCIPSKAMIATGGAMSLEPPHGGMGLVKQVPQVDLPLLRGRIAGITELTAADAVTLSATRAST